jgi:hypothetical protein
VFRETAPNSETDKLVHQSVIDSWHHDAIDAVYNAEEDLLDEHDLSEIPLAPVFRVTTVNEP